MRSFLKLFSIRSNSFPILGSDLTFAAFGLQSFELLNHD